MKKIISILIVLLIGAFITGCNDKKENIKVIDFSEYNIEEVIDWGLENDCIQKIKFKYESSNDIDKDKVINQSLNCGAIFDENILVTISSGKPLLYSDDGVEVPNIIGLSLNEAKEKLERLGFSIGDIKYNRSSKAKDVVLISDPLPGILFKAGEKVNLTLSSGEKRESQFILKLDVKDIDGDKNIKVYIDGEIQRQYTKIVDESVSYINLTLTGSGTKHITVKANNEIIYSKDIDFENRKEL